jgi:hypothetical protein
VPSSETDDEVTDAQVQQYVGYTSDQAELLPARSFGFRIDRGTGTIIIYRGENDRESAPAGHGAEADPRTDDHSAALPQ